MSIPHPILVALAAFGVVLLVLYLIPRLVLQWYLSRRLYKAYRPQMERDGVPYAEIVPIKPTQDESTYIVIHALPPDSQAQSQETM